MTLDVAACDAWRRDYDVLTVADQKAFYDQVYREHPRQSHYNAEKLFETIERYMPGTVHELGGWDGEAALELLPRSPWIRSWTNIEVCPLAAQAGVDRARGSRVAARYGVLCPDTWYWEQTWSPDLFVASHTIEHLKARDLEAVVQATNARVLYFDAPLWETPVSWAGSITTHILEVGWLGVDEICERHGYTKAWRKTHKTEPRSGDVSTVSVYERVKA